MKRLILFAVAALASFAVIPSATAQETNANVNLASCIKKTTNIGSTTYHNVCNGTQRVVEWGVGDWLGALSLTILIAVFLILIVFALGGLIWMTIKDQW